jgi:hypothetical protein
MTVYVADMHAHVQGLVSVVKIATVLEECTNEDQHSVVFLCEQKDSINAKHIHKEMFPVYDGKC